MTGPKVRLGRGAWSALCAVVAVAAAVRAQGVDPADPAGQMQGMTMSMPGQTRPGWQFLQDGQIDLLFNRQSGARGGREATAPNWWMGMASRTIGRQQLRLVAMLSLDAATEGKAGYRELFQTGEELDGVPLVDRQHPHDLFMQVAALWRAPIGSRSGLTIAGGPAGEPALGPVAFMHRASAAELPFAPLSHHTLDSTHISFGVITGAFDRGPWIVEGSIFNGREPDDNRWNFDFGRLDSESVRVWFHPGGEWQFQASTGHLTEPEALEPGDIERTTASADWWKKTDGGFRAATLAYGVNARGGGRQHALLAEFTRETRTVGVSARFELVQPDTSLLEAGSVPDPASPAFSTVGALTGAIARHVAWSRFADVSLGAAATLNATGPALRAAYGAHPLSAQFFVRLQPRANPAGRMWNMRMAQPMDMTAGVHSMPMDMTGSMQQP